MAELDFPCSNISNTVPVTSSSVISGIYTTFPTTGTSGICAAGGVGITSSNSHQTITNLNSEFSGLSANVASNAIGNTTNSTLGQIPSVGLRVTSSDSYQISNAIPTISQVWILQINYLSSGELRII